MQCSRDHIFGAALTNQNVIDEEIESMLKPKIASLTRCSIFCPQLHSPHFMEVEGSLSHSQDSTTCPYPSQINPFLCPSHFGQPQRFSFLVGLRIYQHTSSPNIKDRNIKEYNFSSFV